MITFKQYLTEAKEIWYHGSNSKIDSFSLDHLGKGQGHDTRGPGIYLTNNPEDAKIYGKYIHEVEVNMVKSKILTDKVKTIRRGIRILISKCPDPDDLYNWDQNKSRAINVATDSICKYNPIYRNALEQVWYDFYRHEAAKYLEKLQVFGYQGFTIIPGSDGHTVHFICWDPSILKVKGLME